jgi:hypothetical protein
LGLHQGHSDDTDSSYYTEIYNYLASQAMPAGATESYKKILKKRARNYKVSASWFFVYHTISVVCKLKMRNLNGMNFILKI